MFKGLYNAHKFFKGFRTLEDLKSKAALTRQQKIGIKYYDEFKQRIPRSEVVEIERIVKLSILKTNFI